MPGAVIRAFRDMYRRHDSWRVRQDTKALGHVRVREQRIVGTADFHPPYSTVIGVQGGKAAHVRLTAKRPGMLARQRAGARRDQAGAGTSRASRNAIPASTTATNPQHTESR